MNQAWGPNDAAGASAYLASIYERWFDIERRLDKSKHHYLEIKLEDFANSPAEILEQIRDESGLEAKFEHIPEISVAKVDNWQDFMSRADISILNNSLGATIEKLGYKI
jgi:hypothetical protein